jgi:hypothetical protein
MINFLDELAALGRNSVEFRALLRELLNGDSVIACCEVDDVATIAAGNVVVDCEPSDAFRGALAAFLAEHPEFNQSRMPRHWLAPSTLRQSYQHERTTST